MNDLTSVADDRQQNKPSQRWNAIAAVVFLIFSFAYTVGVILGYVPVDRRIDTVNLVLIVAVSALIVAWINPKLIERVSSIEWSGLRIKMLEVKQRQDIQETQLDRFSLVLKLLLPKSERDHLQVMAEGKTTGFTGSHELRTQLRHLRSMGLIRNSSGRLVKQIEDNTTVDLADYVKLTEFGRQWADSLKQIKAEETNDGEAEASD